MAAVQLVVLLLTLTSFFTVFAEELDTLPPSSPHYPHPPTPAPAPAPVHHHHHPPAAAPAHPPSPVHHYPPPPPTPTPTPTPSPVAKPPTHHHYPPPPSPTPAPAKPPSHPYYPPSPHHPPLHPFPRSFVAVQGVVYCKSCKYAGVDTLLGATPALGAVVKLQCNNSRYPLVQTAKTDKNGYFYVQAPKSITTFGAHKCKVYLVSSPSATCQKPSNLHGGIVGATLKPEKPFVSYKLPFVLYTVGPLAFEPKCPHY